MFQSLERLDTITGIEKYLNDGISGLHQLSRDRRDVTRTPDGKELNNVRLKEWILLGHWYADSIGNISRIHSGFIDGAEQVIAYKDFFSRYGVNSISSSAYRYPTVSDACPQCLKGWELRNLHDHELVRVDEVIEAGPGYRFFHPKCRDLDVTQKVLKEFRRVYEEAGLSSVDMRPCRNEYGSDSYNGPWTLTETPAGLIRMGWRKRVIQIDWSLCRLKSQPDFSSEDVTKGAAYIHAWGYDKAVEYIRKILGCV